MYSNNDSCKHPEICTYEELICKLHEVKDCLEDLIEYKDCHKKDECDRKKCEYAEREYEFEEKEHNYDREKDDWDKKEYDCNKEKDVWDRKEHDCNKEKHTHKDPKCKGNLAELLDKSIHREVLICFTFGEHVACISGKICKATCDTVTIFGHIIFVGSGLEAFQNMNEKFDAAAASQYGPNGYNNKKIITIPLNKICSILWTDSPCNPCSNNHPDPHR